MKNLLMLIAVTFSFTFVNAQNNISVKKSDNAQSVAAKKSCGKSCTKSCCSKETSKKSCSSSKETSKKSCSSSKKSCSKSCGSSKAAYSKLVSPQDFKSYMERFPAEQVVDVRTKAEIAENGMIDGAKNIDYNQSYFKEEMLKLDKNAAVMVYCRSGGRSGKTAMLLKSWGFKKIYDMEGGYNAYLKAFPKK